jgi:hypothetical protein
MFLLTLAVATALSYPPAGYELGLTQESPKHTFRIETYEKETEGGYQHSVWVVGNDRSRAELLVGPEALTPQYSVEISISPDERWIMWRQKLHQGADAVSLAERSSGLRYRALGPPIFSEQAWRFLAEQTRRKFTTDYIHITRISDWPSAGSLIRNITLYGDEERIAVPTPDDHTLLLSLHGDDRKTWVRLWFCFYDLQKHRFYLDAALRKRNRGSVDSSRE